MIKDFVFGLVAPAGPVRSISQLDLALSRMREFGWNYKEGRTVRSQSGFLSADDDTRMRDLLAMYTDKHVTHVWCVRGGYGSSRIIEQFADALADVSALKPLIGFSDITVFHCGMMARAKLPGGSGAYEGFHGPMLLSLLGRENVDEFSLRAFVGMLAQGGPEIELGGPEALVPGQGTGLLVGGNLTVCAALCGTQFSLVRNGLSEPLILFLEDVNEPPYRIDRCLMQLKQNDIFQRVVGVILGDFDSERADYNEILGVLASHFSPLSIPVAIKASIGHGIANTTLPYGRMVVLRVEGDKIDCRMM